VRVKNAGLIGEVVPSNWIESQDFIRDGRNLKTGDLVLIGRSDGRLVFSASDLFAVQMSGSDAYSLFFLARVLQRLSDLLDLDSKINGKLLSP
jgi:hypothetical protein